MESPDPTELKRIRTLLKYTQAEMASRIFAGLRSYARYENGYAPIRRKATIHALNELKKRALSQNTSDTSGGHM